MPSTPELLPADTAMGYTITINTKTSDAKENVAR